jgi:aldehyde dehydrogenase (NAD+)
MTSSGTTTTDLPAGDDIGFGPLVAGLRKQFDGGLTRPLAWRKSQLRQIQRLLHEGEAPLLSALAADLGKPAIEGWATDLAIVDDEVEALLRRLDRFVRPEKVKVPLKFRPGRAWVVREPLGVALVIAPWNYPVQLLLAPVACAVAAGNAVVAKPSELAPRTSAELARLVPQYLDQRAVAVVEGGVAETTALLTERFDHILYTGNGRVGRIVMEAAARHLTPVTLELGGKSPAIVDERVDVDVAARRIVWGKFLNAGQTCIAPDYVLVHEAVERPLVDAMVASVRRFYGEDPRLSNDFARIVNPAHFDRLTSLLSDLRPDQVVAGGQSSAPERFIAPTIVRGVSAGDRLMQDEIFGPILPVLTYADIGTAIEQVNAGPKPLALYVFTSRPGVADEVIARTSSGGVCINATLMHEGIPELPFGGVGESGMGAYHGQAGLETFSHRRAALSRPTRLDPAVAYPPYTWLKRKVLRAVM